MINCREMVTATISLVFRDTPLSGVSTWKFFLSAVLVWPPLIMVNSSVESMPTTCIGEGEEGGGVLCNPFTQSKTCGSLRQQQNGDSWLSHSLLLPLHRDDTTTPNKTHTIWPT